MKIFGNEKFITFVVGKITNFIMKIIKYIYLVVLFLAMHSSIAQEKSNVFDGKSRETVQNTNVSIIPPAGFKYIGNQSSFIKEDNYVILQVNEMKDSVFTIDKADRYIEREMKKKDLTMVSRREVETSNKQKAVLYVLKKTTKDRKGKEVIMERVCLLTGTSQKLIWLDSVYPEIMKGQIYRDLYESMISVQF